jgi:hypothetical protein
MLPAGSPGTSIGGISPDRLSLETIAQSGQFFFRDVVDGETQLHDREIDQMAGERRSIRNDHISLLRQRRNGVT